MRQKTTTILLFLLVLLELLSATVWTEYILKDYCRYIHLTSGVGIFYLLMFNAGYPNSIKSRNSKLVPVFLVMVLVFWSVPQLDTLFKHQAIDFHYADMLPVIKTMCVRWLSFSPVYNFIPEIWSGVMPVYLPALYLPYVPAVLLQFDMRWIGYAFTIIPLCYIILYRKSSVLSWLIFVLLGLFFDFILYRRHETFTLSEEGVVYGYYMLLTFLIYKKHFYGTAIVAACCILSRYSGIFFIASLAVCLFIMNHKAEWKKYLSIGFISGSILLTAGRAWSHLGNLFGLSSLYIQNIKENPAKYQDVLNDGIGLMPLIGFEHVQYVFYIQVFLLILVAVGMMVMVRKYHHSFYYPAFLKLSLVVFYNVLILPYSYLMYTSVFVSFVLFFLYANHDMNKEKNPEHA